MWARGRVARTNKLLKTDGGTVGFNGMKDVLLVTVKTYSRNRWDEFVRFCVRNGLTFRIAGEKPVAREERWVDVESGEEVVDRVNPYHLRGDGWFTIYEVTGGRSLGYLAKHPSVVMVEKPLSVGAPHFRSH